MILLLDTHIAIWAALAPDALTQAERRQMAESTTLLVLLAVSVWELRLKWNSLHISGSRKGPLHPSIIVTFGAAMGWEMLSLTARHAATTLAQPISHQDPFDELLLVQAQVEGLHLLTRDARLVVHPLAASGDAAGP